MAASRSASLASGLPTRIAARASSSAFFIRASASLLMAVSRVARTLASFDLKTAFAASKPLDRIGREQSEAAERRLDGAAHAVVDAHRTEPGRLGAGDGLAGCRIEQASRRLAHVDLLVAGAEQQAAVLQRLDHLRRQRVAAGRDARQRPRRSRCRSWLRISRALPRSSRRSRQGPLPAAGPAPSQGTLRARHSVRNSHAFWSGPRM